MEFRIEYPGVRTFRIDEINKIRTPRLVIFSDRVNRNMSKMEALLREQSPPLGLENLCPHVKTVKSSWAVKRMMAAGISFFKCSLNELDLLLQAGAKEILIAYPLLSADAEMVLERKKAFPQTTIYVQISRPEHVKILTNFHTTWHCYLDVNVGMNRTGTTPENISTLYSCMIAAKSFKFAGIHAYDGHVHSLHIKTRQQEAAHSMTRVLNAIRSLADQNVHVENAVVSGTPGFILDAQFLCRQPMMTKFYFSPGTWIYSDTITNALLPGTFECAALLLTQVIDLPTASTAVLNIGHKRWAVDQGAIELFSIPGMSAKNWSEEHTVVEIPTTHPLQIGDYVLIAPRHVCSTVNLWEYFALIDENGMIKDLRCPVDGRNR